MRALFASVTIVVIAATGCMAGHGAAPPATAAPSQAQQSPEAMGAMSMQSCPMAIPGTQVSAAETSNGESVTFTTSPDHAADLRERVHAMADMHNHHHQGDGMEGMHGDMQHGDMMASGEHMAMMPPPSRAVVEDVEGGARIVVTPNDPADLERLRSTVRMHAEHMQKSGTCQMEHADDH